MAAWAKRSRDGVSPEFSAASRTQRNSGASSSVTARDLPPVARALVRGFVARPGGAAVSVLAGAATGALVDHLSGSAVSGRPSRVGAGRVRELMALAEALHAD